MRLNWIYVLCAAISFSAFAENQGYRVRTKAQTLIQIARDIYKDERQWKDIAYWNGIKSPYHLNVGQVLILKQPPVVPIPAANLVKGSSLEPIEPLPKRASVERKIEKEGGSLIYIVNERAPSLAMVARELYGDVNMAGKIANWGGFESTSRLSLGQRLRLKVPPTKTAAQGTDILIANWAARGNDMMVERLEEIAKPGIRKPATAAKSKVKSQGKKDQPTCNCNCNCNGGGCSSSGPARQVSTPTAVSGVPGPATPGPAADGIASPSAGAASGERQPQSIETDSTPLPNKNDSPDGIPSAHKTETYWLGDEAKRLLKVIESKVPTQ